MAYLDSFNPEKIDSTPEVRQQLRIIKKAIAAGEIGGNSISYSDLGFESFSPAKSYNIGDIVEKDGVLYIFTQSHSGSWNTSDVKTTTLEDLVYSYQVINLGELSNYTGVNLDGYYTIPTTSGNIVYYELLNEIWSSGKIPVITVTLTYHTATYAVLMTKDANGTFNGHDRAENGDYTIDIVISSTSGKVNTRMFSAPIKIVNITDSISTLNCNADTIYNIADPVTTLSINLPSSVAGSDMEHKCTIYFSTDTSTPNITLSSVESVPIWWNLHDYIDNFNTQSNYQIDCEYNGFSWLVSSRTIADNINTK